MLGARCCLPAGPAPTALPLMQLIQQSTSGTETCEHTANAPLGLAAGPGNAVNCATGSTVTMPISRDQWWDVTPSQPEECCSAVQHSQPCSPAQLSSAQLSSCS